VYSHLLHCTVKPFEFFNCYLVPLVNVFTHSGIGSWIMFIVVLEFDHSFFYHYHSFVCKFTFFSGRAYII
jgi:hypothetical protein